MCLGLVSSVHEPGPAAVPQPAVHREERAQRAQRGPPDLQALQGDWGGCEGLCLWLGLCSHSGVVLGENSVMTGDLPLRRGRPGRNKAALVGTRLGVLSEPPGSPPTATSKVTSSGTMPRNCVPEVTSDKGTNKNPFFWRSPPQEDTPHLVPTDEVAPKTPIFNDTS